MCYFHFPMFNYSIKLTPFRFHSKKNKTKLLMFGHLTLIVTEVLIGLTTITVNPSFTDVLPDPFFAFVRCAAFPGLVVPNVEIFDVHNTLALHTETNFLIEADADNNPLVSGATYTVRCCTASPFLGVPATHTCGELVTVVHTPPPSTCKTGVSIASPHSTVDITPTVFTDRIDMGHSVFYDFPPSMMGMEAYTLPRSMAAGSKITFTCCGGSTCLFTVALYRCIACTGPRPHGINQHLLLDQWESSSCSPQFDDSQKTTSFYKVMGSATGPTESVTFELRHDELMQAFGRSGTLNAPFCAAPKPHGPFPAGPNCGDRCPRS